MPTLNPASDISAFINSIFEASIMVARDNNVMTGLVRPFNDKTGVAVRQNSQYSGLIVNAVAETDDLTGQAFTPSSIATLTPSEFGGQYFLTDTRVESDPFAVRNDAALDMGLAMSTKIESDLIASVTSFTGGTFGAAGSVLTLGHILAMETVLRAQKAPYPYFMVMHPYQWQPIGKAVSATASATNAPESLKEEINNNFFIRQIGGVSVFVSSNVAIDTLDDAIIGMWSRDALALDMRRAPRIEYERDASRRGWELNLSTIYAKGVWRPKFGVKGTFDASVPTS